VVSSSATLGLKPGEVSQVSGMPLPFEGAGFLASCEED